MNSNRAWAWLLDLDSSKWAWTHPDGLDSTEGSFSVLSTPGGTPSMFSGKRKFYDGGVGVCERVGDKRPVCRGCEDGDGSAAAEEEASEVENWDGVTFGHEWKEHYMWCGRNSSHLSLSLNQVILLL
ncbi:UDP-Glycosyltransferase superfamily protein [Actinidia rufa]|uniref:UDP-Glycosyltransferase superfamily protein n=1 Tax=Actinidia rufa TaxID=165716 RepID=A0A7J0FBA9_9ERIC|nr:UDP-Glycosyltransferase superfamily protein [Actinidia rufa]